MSYNTCRFCGKSTLDSSDDMVKYGTRHYAHFKCYLDAGKSLDGLHPWQVGLFPFRLLKDRNLIDHPKVKASEKLTRDVLSVERAVD